MSLPSLYVISAEYQSAVAQLADLDLDEQTFADTLESLSGDLEAKAKNVAMFALELEASAKARREAAAGLCRWRKRRTEMTNYKSMFEQAVRTLAAIDEALGIGDDGCGDPDQTLTAIAELKSLQKMESQQLRKIHPLDFPIEVFLADLTTRPANIIRAELAGFASYAGTGTFDIEPPFTVRHLCMFSRSEMRKWPNFGRKCLNEVEEMLRARGLQLWENHDERSLRLLREHKEYFK